MASLVIWAAALAMQALALLAASLGGYYLAALALGMLSMLLMVTT